MVLNSDAAVKAFSRGGNVTIGGSVSAAAGPIGTGGQISGSLVNPAPIFSYSRSKGKSKSRFINRPLANYNTHKSAVVFVPSPRTGLPQAPSESPHHCGDGVAESASVEPPYIPAQECCRLRNVAFHVPQPLLQKLVEAFDAFTADDGNVLHSMYPVWILHSSPCSWAVA